MKEHLPLQKIPLLWVVFENLRPYIFSRVFLNDGTGTSPYSTSETRDDNYKENAV